MFEPDACPLSLAGCEALPARDGGRTAARDDIAFFLISYVAGLTFFLVMLN